MKIAFVCNKCLPFHGTTLEERPLGGTETAVIRLAEALARRGAGVTVFTSAEIFPERGASDEPLYKPLAASHHEKGIDVLISVRDWMPLVLPLAGRARLYWTADAADQVHSYGLGDKRVAQRVTAFLAVGTWHAQTMCETSNFPTDKTMILPLGIHAPFFDGQEPRKRKRLIYSSTPYRGLALVPDLFASVRQRHPDAELHIFSGFEVYSGGGAVPSEEVRAFNTLKERLEKMDGVFLHGNVRQKELAREFMRSSVLFYPNTFPETFCITAMEALAGGCAVVSSDLGALPETVGDGGLVVGGTLGSPHFAQAFLEATDTLLSNDDLFYQMTAHSKRRALDDYSYDTIAERFMILLSKLLSQKSG